MNASSYSPTRRTFLKSASALPALAVFPADALPAGPDKDKTPLASLHLVGPKEGYTPHIGTLVSMLNWMRDVVLYSVQGMTQAQLDHLHDPKANTIGAMLLHLAATEVWYQANTFEGRPDYNEAEKARWAVAMGLGDEGRKQIKGHPLEYYLNILKETREKTLTELKNRDDKWLMKVDPSFFGKQPTNNYCKWFHVCEHESNHNGQIKWIKSRIPGSEKGED